MLERTLEMHRKETETSRALVLFGNGKATLSGGREVVCMGGDRKPSLSYLGPQLGSRHEWRGQEVWV